MGGAGEQQGVQTASAPLVPLKHHPPNTTRSSGQAPPAPALCTVSCRRGAAGEGAIPQARRCPLRCPSTPVPGRGMRHWEKCSRSLSGFEGSPVTALSLAHPPPPATEFPPGTLQPAPPQGQALLASLTAAAPLTGVAGSGPGCWTEREPTEGGEQGRPAWLGQQEGAWPCSPDAETASKEVKWELCLWVKGGEGSGPRRGGTGHTRRGGSGE